MIGAINEYGIVAARDLAATRAWWEKSDAQGCDKAIHTPGWLQQNPAARDPSNPAAALPWIETSDGGRLPLEVFAAGAAS